MDKKIRHFVILLICMVIIILVSIAINHVENYKNVKEEQYLKRVNNTIIDALAEINTYELNQHITDSLKYKYWGSLRPIQDRHLRFHPIGERGKWKILRQIVAYEYPEIPIDPEGIEPFYCDDYIPAFVAGQDLVKEILNDVHLNTFYDSLKSHLENVPTYQQEESDSIRRILKRHLSANSIRSDFEYCIYVPSFKNFVLCGAIDTIKTITEGHVYNFEIYNENAGLFSFFVIRFLEKKDYLTLYDNFVVVVTWGMVILIWCLFFSLLLSEKRISEVVALRDDFINNITHEFKTPISTISLASESLLDKDISEDVEMREKCIDVIREENERLERMVETILQTASISRKSFLQRQKKSELDVQYCIEPAVKEILTLLHQKKGSITVEYSAKKAIVYIDEPQIILVIKNILDNAIKYTLNEPPHLEIKTANRGKYILISIKDNGLGITKKEQKKIFNKLYRSSTGDVHDVKGYGLGLYNAQAIVKSHKGKIEVESEINKGSTFTICLPTVK
ncbi:MAG: HAMP domain-containing histidine kinase [Bacteroidales bacterium]|jgi:two-component system phosphate regulon sensor histidine kinase PhoR|nr:HAMP domain-containing histidine kinase [Bacteroidales bacterium]